MDGHTPNPTQARMMNLQYPKSATSTCKFSEGETFVAFLNEHMPFRVFIEQTPDQAHPTARKFKGKTEGNEIIGVTGSEYLITSPEIVLTYFVDITDLEEFSIEWADGLHPQNLENHLNNA